MTQFSGVVEAVVFTNEDTGFQILRIAVEHGVQVAFVAHGVFNGVELGDQVAFQGEWFDHPLYGERVRKVL